jgi:hypothetical protein
MTICIVDEFAMPDGPIGGNWIDAFDLQHEFTDIRGTLATRPGIAQIGQVATEAIEIVPSSGRQIRVRPRAFSQTRVVDQKATFQASVSNANRFPSGEHQAHYEIGHFLIYQPLGVTDDLEVGVRWLPTGFIPLLSQVSPVAFVDPFASNPVELGLLPVWDAGISRMYIQNEWRSPESQAFNTFWYRILGSDGSMHRPGTHPTQPPSLHNPGGWPAPAAHDVALRVKGGEMAMYWDGVKVLGPFGVPAVYHDRDGWGIHVIAIQVNPDIGATYHQIWPSLPSVVISSDFPAQVERWWAKSFTGDWGDPF